MFENMKTHGGGTITLEFEDEPIEEAFRRQFKTEKDFMKTIPDEINEISTEVIVKIINPRNEMLEFINFLTLDIMDSLFTRPMKKFSGPTEEQFVLYMKDIHTVSEIQENNEDNCLICLNPNCPTRRESFDEDLYKKAVIDLQNE